MNEAQEKKQHMILKNAGIKLLDNPAALVVIEL